MQIIGHPPQTYWVRNSGYRAQQSVFLSSPYPPARWQWSLRTTGLDSLYSEWGLWISSSSVSWERVRHRASSQTCRIRISYISNFWFWNNFRLAEGLQNCTVSSHVPFPQLSLMLTSYLTMGQLSKRVGSILLTELRFIWISPVSHQCLYSVQDSIQDPALDSVVMSQRLLQSVTVFQSFLSCFDLDTFTEHCLEAL